MRASNVSLNLRYEGRLGGRKLERAETVTRPCRAIYSNSVSCKAHSPPAVGKLFDVRHMIALRCNPGPADHVAHELEVHRVADGQYFGSLWRIVLAGIPGFPLHAVLPGQQPLDGLSRSAGKPKKYLRADPVPSLLMSSWPFRASPHSRR